MVSDRRAGGGSHRRAAHSHRLLHRRLSAREAASATSAGAGTAARRRPGKMMNEHELWLTWQTYQARLDWLDRLRGADGAQEENDAQLALALLPKVTALQ